MIRAADPEIDYSNGVFGKPVAKSTPKPRAGLFDQFARAKQAQRGLRASYDAASAADEFKNYWANADALDADSANSRSVREKLVQRSRYETANNGYAAGITATLATDIVGKGPKLRMQTSSDGFNRMVEREWMMWTKEIRFRRKLWCLAHAYDQDGESFGVMRRNRGLRHPVKLDFVLHETEQCQTPFLNYRDTNYIDGIKFDNWGNPVWYDFLDYHPGGNSDSGFVYPYDLTPERVPAQFVCHWFRMERPGQHRGIPVRTPTLNLGASRRRWNEATVAAAENIADYSLLIKTQFEPDEMDTVDPMSTLDIEKRMMVALPAGYDAFQPKAEQPTANHAEFNRELIKEQARPRAMPYNKAACDSSNHNFASGRLDHIPYYGMIEDVDREDCVDLVLDPLFGQWFNQAVLVFNWLGGNPEVLNESARAHRWDWPKHTTLDQKAEADQYDKRLKNGTVGINQVYSECGKDYDDELEKMAAANGVTVDQQRQINLLLNVPQHLTGQVAQIIGLQTEPEPKPMVDDEE